MNFSSPAVLRWIRSWGGHHPLFALALASAGCVAAASWDFRAGLALASGISLVAGGLAGWRIGLISLCCGGLAAGVFTYRIHSRDLAEKRLLASPAVELQARVLQDGRGSERLWKAPAVVISGTEAGASVWWEGRGAPPVAGSVVKARGAFSPLPHARNPGEFDLAAWLRGQNVAAIFKANWADNEVYTGRWASFGARIRQGFRRAVTIGLAEESQESIVIRAVVIGEQPPDAEDLVAAFRNSGTLHAFSVSGLHVAMVGSMGWLLLRALGISRRWAVIGLLPLIFGYSWITGNSAPAVRSAWMAAVFLGAFVFRRRPDLLNALGAVLLTAMLWDGRLLFQAGVQLSYGVVAAIALGTAWAMRLFHWIEKPELYLPMRKMNSLQKASLWLRRNTAQSLGVSVAAGVGSAPLTAIHFGLITPISVFAGVILVPLVFVLLSTSLLAASFYPVLPFVSCWVNRMNGYVAEACVLTARAFASIPGGHLQLRSENRPSLMVYDLEAGAGAACFHGGDGEAVLLDCGDRYGFKRRIVPSLRRLGVAPDSVVFSHPDGDHLGGGAQVWETLPIRQVILPVERSRSPSFRAWRDEPPQARIRVMMLSQTPQIPLPDGALLEVVHLPEQRTQSAAADERVAIFRLHWRGWKILLTSDAGMETELELVKSGKDLTADLIIAGRNRSDLSLSDPFLEAVKPRAIIASHAAFPVAEQLPSEAVNYWKSRGIQVVHQGESGGVTVRVDDAGELVLEGYVDRSLVTLKPR